MIRRKKLKKLKKEQTIMNHNEKAISLVLNILLLIGFVVALLYGGAILDWIDSWDLGG